MIAKQTINSHTAKQYAIIIELECYNSHHHEKKTQTSFCDMFTLFADLLEL